MRYAPHSVLRYLYIDFNAFFAAVEQHDAPELRGRPVVVATTASRHAHAIAVSYEARAAGLSRGVKVGEALVAEPQTVVRIARHDRYVEMHQTLMNTIETCLPLDKVYSVDEAAFRLSPREASPSAALAMGAHVKETLVRSFSPAMRSSIGLAPTRLLAKIAAGLKKPDGLTALELKDAPTRLADMPLKAIPGIGGGVAARLAKNGVTDFAGLWALEPKHARRIWGSVQGERFWYALHGYEVDEPATQRSMIGHSRVLNPEHQNLDDAHIVARALLLKCASRLRRDGFLTTAITVTARIKGWRQRGSRAESQSGQGIARASTRGRFDRNRYAADRSAVGRWERTLTLDATQDSFPLLEALRHHWDALEGAGAQRLGGVSVYLHSLRKPDDARVRQGELELLPNATDAKEHRPRRDRSALWSAVDYINADPDGRFARLGGASAKQRPLGSTNPRHVTLATQTNLDLRYLGAKIAFSRVPDPEEFAL